MDKILKWIKIHKKLTTTLIILIILLPIIVIHLLFKIHSNCYWIEAEWQAGEILGYFGDVLAFIGTIVLGYVAIMQAEKANNLNNELLKIEKNRIKPCFDISSQLYKIFLEEDMNEKLNELDRNNVMIMDLLYTITPRTGVTTDSALLELDVLNSGFSDIRRIFVKKAFFYLSVSEPIDCNNEKIVTMYGNNTLKAGETKKLYIHIQREVSDDEEWSNNWYTNNIDKLMPHMEFEIEMETIEGNSYIEKIVCGSSWDISMKNIRTTATRAIGVTEVDIQEKVSR